MSHGHLGAGRLINPLVFWRHSSYACPDPGKVCKNFERVTGAPTLTKMFVVLASACLSLPQLASASAFAKQGIPTDQSMWVCPFLGDPPKRATKKARRNEYPTMLTAPCPSPSLHWDKVCQVPGCAHCGAAPIRPASCGLTTA